MGNDRDTIGQEINLTQGKGHELNLPTKETLLIHSAVMEHPIVAALIQWRNEWMNLKAIGAIHTVDRPARVKVLPNLWHLQDGKGVAGDHGATAGAWTQL